MPARGQRDRLNDDDDIYRQSGGQILLNVTEDGGVYSSTFDIGLQMYPLTPGPSPHDKIRRGERGRLTKSFFQLPNRFRATVLL
jgi:hypothetical protein